MIINLLQQRDTNQNQLKGDTEGKTVLKAKLLSSLRKYYYPLSSSVCDNLQRIAKPGRLTQAFSVQSFYLDLIIYCLCPDLQFPVPSEVGTNKACFREPIISQIVSVFSGQSPKGTPIRLQEPGGHLTITKGKDQIFLWVKLILYYTVS